ncbi:hypothetical protein [Nostoc sp. S13]|nr:hypothetical protein [Nostoc sp. S13]
MINNFKLNNMNFKRLNLNQWNQWLNRRQLQVLEAAYKAAQNIKALEDKYFNGGKITYAPNQTKTLVEYVQKVLDLYLFHAILGCGFCYL